MGHTKEKMAEDLALCNYSSTTRQAYLRVAHNFVLTVTDFGEGLSTEHQYSYTSGDK